MSFRIHHLLSVLRTALLLKINQSWWVFYGALSNVEYTVTVTDAETGAVKTYFNPLSSFASSGDTAAFPEMAKP